MISIAVVFAITYAVSRTLDGYREQNSDTGNIYAECVGVMDSAQVVNMWVKKGTMKWAGKQPLGLWRAYTRATQG